MFVAHIHPNTLKEQSVKEHLYNVSKMAREYSAKISLSSTGELIGALHDMGKQTDVFNAYIHYSSIHPHDKSRKGAIDHSTAGAKFIYDNFYGTKDLYQRCVAQMISLAAYSHHGGLGDCLDLEGNDLFARRINKDKEIFYDEAVANFIEECYSIKEIEALFNKSKQEIKNIIGKINEIDTCVRFRKFAFGMTERYVFSCLIDADRYDTYKFMEQKEQKKMLCRTLLWKDLSQVLENKLMDYPKLSKIDLLREEISDACKRFAENATGIYQLSVPTGGGKTLSSLRYALQHAKQFEKERIFYIVPFTTVIDQNAKEVKEILGREDIVLEHHSNLIRDHEDDEQSNYKLLTERWDSPIVFTTMVQFLDTLFNGGTQALRRMHNLANSIIIFDEIQALPIKCINMFNSAINFLSYICDTTVILCTATQPLLDRTDIPLKLSANTSIINNIDEKFKQFKRINLVDARITGGYSTEVLKEFIINRMDEVKSTLIILNTKNAAKKIFSALKEENRKLNAQKQCHIFHLSTSMCPTHRLAVLESIRESLGKYRIICISTQLIEAGVNISFECVVRSLAGLDSIAQAAGRCNRHGEGPCSNVYIVNIEEENVEKLIDISEAQECTRRILDEFVEQPETFDNDLLSPKAMNRYYEYYFYNRRKEMNYTLPKQYVSQSMYDLLSTNYEADNAFKERNGEFSQLILKQAFKTAGNYFQVIDQNTLSVIVPYKEGKELITRINGNCQLSDLKQYLSKAQHFSVNLFETDRRRLNDMGAIIGLKDGLVWALREGYYDEEVGVIADEKPMTFYNF